MYLHQAEADELVWFLAVDYLRLISVVEEVFAHRRVVLKKLNKYLKEQKD